MNTKISYLYRDADNYKMHNKCVIAGTLTTEQARTIKDSCEMGEYFIPRQVGLPERRFDRYDPAVDHCWFELDEDCFSETIEPPTVALTATELVNRFEGYPTANVSSPLRTAPANWSWCGRKTER